MLNVSTHSFIHRHQKLPQHRSILAELCYHHSTINIFIVTNYKLILSCIILALEPALSYFFSFILISLLLIHLIFQIYQLIAVSVSTLIIHV